MNIEQLRIQAKADMEAAKARVAEKVEIIQLTAQIQLANSEAMQNALAATAITEQASDKLKSLEAICEQIIATMPEINRKTRKNFEWSPRREYGLGLHIQALTGLLNGIQYSSHKHKPHLLAALGLSEHLIESTLDALGSPSYYSENYSTIIPETPACVETLNNNLLIIEQALGITLDKSKIDETSFKTRFEVARLKAELDQADAMATLALQAQKVAI